MRLTHTTGLTFNSQQAFARPDPRNDVVTPSPFQESFIYIGPGTTVYIGPGTIVTIT